MTMPMLTSAVRSTCAAEVAAYRRDWPKFDDQSVNTTISQYVLQANTPNGTFAELAALVQKLGADLPKAHVSFHSGGRLQICTLRYVGSLRGASAAAPGPQAAAAPPKAAPAPAKAPPKLLIYHPARLGGQCLKVEGGELSLTHAGTNSWAAEVTLRNSCDYAIELIIAGFVDDGRVPTMPYPTATLYLMNHVSWPGSASFGPDLPFPKLDFDFRSPLFPDVHRTTVHARGEWVHRHNWQYVDAAATLKLHYKTAYCRVDGVNSRGEAQTFSAFFNGDFTSYLQAPGQLHCAGWSRGDVERWKAIDPNRQHLVPPKPVAAGDHVGRAERLLVARDFRTAQQELTSVLANLPPSDPRRAQLYLLLGQAYAEDGKPASAVKALYEGYKSKPRGPFAAQALNELGAGLSRLGKQQEACAAFAEIRATFRPSEVPEAQWQAIDRNRVQAGCGTGGGD